ncbi:MAG: UvrD-helicase domain-containing protein, partial [Polyangiaceae bacterium]|nr:UvrD-helicase domain-containing protein [Polyangiaceae bacterium]
RLLVVTFTEKATNELRTRIRTKLEEIDRGEGRPPVPDEVRAGDLWVLNGAARQSLSRAVRAFDAATITTIHAFCRGVLRDHAFASGRLFEEKHVDGREAFGRALRDALRREVAGDAERGPWLEVALAQGWSIDRIEDLLWRCASAHAGLRPEVDLGALSRALAAMPVVDMGDRQLIDAIRSWGAHPSTARAVANRVFELSEAAAQARAGGGAAAFVAEAARIDTDKIISGLSGIVSPEGPAARACLAAVDLARLTPPFQAALAVAILPPTLGALVRTKRETGRYDFDDMLSLLDEALAGPRGASLATSMRRRFSHALIDEFQDTDETQWSIFHRAFIAGTGGPRTQVFLVGDPKQSIYRFRGADVHAYLGACEELARGGATRVTLDRNFRSTPALVDAQNIVFGPGSAEPIFDGSIAYVPVSCGRPERALVDGAGAPLSAVHVLRQRGEASLEALGVIIAREIKTAMDPASPWRFDGRTLELHDFFVLTRTTREGRVVGAALRRAGVAHAYYKEEGLFQTDEARDLLAVLRAIADPDDRACRLAAWLTPFFGVSLDAVERVRDVAAGHPLVERLRGWRRLAEARQFGALFEAIVRESGVVRREIFFADGEREVTNYLHLLELLHEHTRAGHVTLTELVAELAGLIAQMRLPLRLEGNVQRLESERRAVQIMTIHKSKGLEAPVVFVAGGTSQPRSDDVRVYHTGGRRLAWLGEPSSGVKPLVRAEESEEDQRLVYVAFTRAQGRLYLPCLVDDSGRPKKLRRGAYDRMNRRIAEVTSTTSALFTVEDVAPAESRGHLDGSRAGDAQAGAFRPAVDWFAAFAADDRTARARVEALRRAHAGLVLTSYTRMKSGAPRSRVTGAFRESASGEDDEVFAGHGERDAAVLGRTRSSGVFLHELLERVPMDSFSLPRDPLCWRARPDVRRVFDEAMAVHRVDPEQRDYAERLVWSAYTTPLMLPGGATLEGGLASAARVVREMPFVFGQAGDRVLVQGALDVVFEHAGLTYFIDWKSDSLPAYTPEVIAQRVMERYEGQLRLYTMAVSRLLGAVTPEDHAARFGGLLYCFLRGFGAGGAGLFVHRPTRESIVAWGRELEAWSAEVET